VHDSVIMLRPLCNCCIFSWIGRRDSSIGRRDSSIGRCDSSMVACQTVVLQSQVRIRHLPSPQLTANLLVGCHLGWHLPAGWPLWGATEEKITKTNPGSPKTYKEKKKFSWIFFRIVSYLPFFEKELCKSRKFTTNRNKNCKFSMFFNHLKRFW
jgi:hypothetical protein